MFLRFRKIAYLSCAVGSILAGVSLNAEIIPKRDIEFARVEKNPLLLDLFLPAKQKGPMIVWIHGGAWRAGSRKEMPLQGLVEAGYPVASVDYRLSTTARFPAQIFDIKAAIRYLRANAKQFECDANRIVIAGASAGGHLAALVGVSNGLTELEGNIGGHTNQSSSVQGIISFFGGSDLTTILSQSTPHGLSVRVPALNLLLGGQPDQKPELAKLASPVFHVDKSDPPLFLLHGDQDLQMPVNQALQLKGAYEQVNVKVRLKILHGTGHGGDRFFDQEHMALVQAFLEDLK